MSRRCVLPLILLLVAASVRAAAAEELPAALDRLARAAVSEDGVTGAVIGVARASEAPALAAAGYGDLVQKKPMRRDSGFKVASVAKSFMAALALVLADEHKIALDDKLKRFLPDLPNAERVSLRQLMNHTSGYDDYASDAFVAAVRAEPSKSWSAAELLAYLHPERLDFQPGSRFDYSNSNFLLLRLALAAALGHSPLQDIRLRFIAPLGLNATWFKGEEAGPEASLAHGYSDLDGSGTLKDVTGEPEVLAGDTTLVSSVPDLLRWSLALFGGRVLDPPRLAEMLSFVAPSEDDSAPGSGYGLGVERFKYLGLTFYGHSGSLAGYNSIMLYEPVSETAIAVAFNCDPADDALLDIVVERVIRTLGQSGRLRLPKGFEGG